jgi:hypothetical protein
MILENDELQTCHEPKYNHVGWDEFKDTILIIGKDSRSLAQLAEAVHGSVDSVKARFNEIEHGTHVYTYEKSRSWSDPENQSLLEFDRLGRTDFQTIAHEMKRTTGAIKTQLAFLKRTSWTPGPTPINENSHSNGNENGNGTSSPSPLNPLLSLTEMRAQTAEMQKQTAMLEEIKALLTTFCSFYK